MSLQVRSDLSIDEQELEFRTGTSTGPGGQHVNRTETRVTLLFDVGASPSLTEEQREKIFARLATRINREGVLRVSSQKHRSQSANRELVIERFQQLLADALHEAAPRRPTRPSRAAKRRRVDDKKKRGRTKDLRKPPRED